MSAVNQIYLCQTSYRGLRTQNEQRGMLSARGDVCHFLVGWRASKAGVGNLFLPRAIWLFIMSFT